MQLNLESNVVNGILGILLEIWKCFLGPFFLPVLFFIFFVRLV